MEGSQEYRFGLTMLHHKDHCMYMFQIQEGGGLVETINVGYSI